MNMVGSVGTHYSELLTFVVSVGTFIVPIVILKGTLLLYVEDLRGGAGEEVQGL